MISDVDYSLLATKLEALEHRIKELEGSITVLNAYVDTQLKNKYKGVDAVGYLGCLRCGLYTCNGTACINSGYPNHVVSIKVPDVDYSHSDCATVSINAVGKHQPDKGDYTIKGHTPYITYDDILEVL